MERKTNCTFGANKDQVVEDVNPVTYLRLRPPSSARLTERWFLAVRSMGLV
jgi:hypothetical protein